MPNPNKQIIQRIVNNLLLKDISIQKDLQRGIINTRALALFLIKNYALQTSLDAVISAIRRFQSDETFAENKELENVFKDMVILTKNNIVSIKLKDNAFADIAKDFMNNQLLKKNLRLAKTKEYVRILISKNDFENKINVFKKDDILEIKQNLCEIRLVLSKDYNNTKGLLAKITSELALHNVNIYDTIICMPEILFYVDEKDLIAAQKSIIEL
jgi:aspartokinase